LLSRSELELLRDSAELHLSLRELAATLLGTPPEG
jgi:hypothetical protein